MIFLFLPIYVTIVIVIIPVGLITVNLKNIDYILKTGFLISKVISIENLIKEKKRKNHEIS